MSDDVSVGQDLIPAPEGWEYLASAADYLENVFPEQGMLPERVLTELRDLFGIQGNAVTRSQLIAALLRAFEGGAGAGD